MVAATVIMITGSNLLSLGAFGVSSWLSIAALSFCLTMFAVAMFYMVSILGCLLLRVKAPGAVLQTFFGIIAGSLAIALLGLMLPRCILFGGDVLLAVPYATANTALIWVLGFVTSSVRKDLRLLPTW